MNTSYGQVQILNNVLHNQPSKVLKILVLAPHPDDDVIMAAGVIFRAVSMGNDVKVVYLTNGDLGGKILGILRQNEAVVGMKTLGVSEENLIFLGYPDAHLMEMNLRFVNFWDSLVTKEGISSTYASRGQGRKDYHSYRFNYAARYNKANLLMDLKDILKTYQPDHIITPSEFDQHGDHVATYQFLKESLWDLQWELPNFSPTVHKTIVHWDDGNWPRPMNTLEKLSRPSSFSPLNDFYKQGMKWEETHLDWNARESIPVPSQMLSMDSTLNLKQLSLSAHFSQGGSVSNHQYIHADEIFWPENLSGGREIHLLPKGP